MKFLVLSFLVSVVAVNARYRPAPSGVGYYYRDFEDSHFPSDAYPVGPNSYIAQIHAHGVLLAGNFNKFTGVAEYAYNGKAYSTKHAVKILCTTDPTQFEWVKTDNKRIHFLLPVKYFIVGGYGFAASDKTLIGRSLNSVQVGSIHLYSQQNGLHYAKNNIAYVDDEFEVLAYKQQ